VRAAAVRRGWVEFVSLHDRAGAIVAGVVDGLLEGAAADVDGAVVPLLFLCAQLAHSRHRPSMEGAAGEASITLIGQVEGMHLLSCVLDRYCAMSAVHQGYVQLYNMHTCAAAYTTGLRRKAATSA
jgi:hypothetical protein